MQSPPPAQPNKFRLPGLGIGLVLLVLFLLSAALAWSLAEKLVPAVMPLLSEADLKKGKDLKEKDSKKAEEFMLKAMKEALKMSGNGLIMADLDCQLGVLYIKQNNREKGEKLIESAMATAANAKAYAKVAKFGDNASWAEHNQFLKNPNCLPKLEYAQKAIAITKQTQGEEATEPYLWVLGELYMDLGDLHKAKECLDKACEIREEAHIEKHQKYHSGTLRRLYALNHQWDKSLEYFLKRYLVESDEKTKTSISREYQRELTDANPEKSKYDFYQVRLLLDKNNFAKLEDLADKVLAKKEILPDGNWRVDKFFQALLFLDDSDSDERWQTYLKDLPNWVLYKPESPAARIALASGYMRYAWKAYINGWANSASDEGWELMQERLTKAHSIAQEAKKMPNHGPHIYEVLGNVAVGQRWSLSDYDQLIAECRKQFPDYLPIYMNKVYYLQPYWNGKKGESENFIKDVSNKIGGESGDIVYAQLVWNLDALESSDNIFSKNEGLDWPRSKRGLLALIKHYPHDTTVRAELISLALQADDQKTLKEVFIPPP